MKGGVGASYKKECPIPELVEGWEKVKGFPNISIDLYNKTTNMFCPGIFNNYNEFCGFLSDNNFGIKIFRNREEMLEEYDKILTFVKQFDLDFIDKYTCIAVTVEPSEMEPSEMKPSEMKPSEIFLNVKHTNLMVFKNSDGNLNDMINHIQLDPLLTFKHIYSNCFEFLKTLHARGVGYRDFKIENILLNVFNDNRIETVIGDMGSLQFFNKYIVDDLYANQSRDKKTLY